MTKSQVISFIKKDISKLEMERVELQKELLPSKGNGANHVAYTHNVSRTHTLKEILSMLTTKN